MAIKIQHRALRSLLNCFSNTYWWGSFSRTRFILMNCGCNRAKAAAQGKKDVQVGLDAKKLQILFQEKKKLWLAYFCLQWRRRVNLSSCLLQLQLSGRRWWYEIVVMSDQIQLSLELSRPLKFQLTKSSVLVLSELGRDFVLLSSC